jgi:TolA-binding protein
LSDAETYFKNNNYQSVILTLEQYYKKNPKSEDLRAKYLLGISYIRINKNKTKGVKLLDDYFKKGGQFDNPEPLILIYDFYNKTVNRKKANFYLKILFNSFPYKPKIIKMKLEYIKKMLLLHNWSEALFYLIDLEDKKFSKEYPIIIFYIAEAYYQKETYEIAAQYFRKYLKINPSLFQYKDKELFMIGKSFYSVGDLKTAEKILSYFINIYPKSTDTPEALFILGDLLLSRKKYVLSATYLYDLMNRFPDSKITNRARIKLADCVAYLDKKEMKKLKIPYYLKEPDKVYKKIIEKTYRLEDKHFAFVKLIEYYNRIGEIENGLFYLFQYLKKKLVEPEGERIYRKYFNRFITKTKDKSRIINYFLKTGKDTTFLKEDSIKKLIKITEKTALYKTEKLLLNRLYILAIDRTTKEEALLGLINNSYNRRDWQEFNKYFKDFQNLYPTVKLPLKYRIYLIYYYLNKKNIKKAKQLIELNYYEALKTEYRNTIDILKLRIQIQTKQWDKAYSLLESLTKRKFIKISDRTDILIPGAIIYMKKGKSDRAIRMLNLIIKDIPKQKDWALFNLGKIFYKKGDNRTAQKYWERLKNSYPTSFWTTQIDYIKNS